MTNEEDTGADSSTADSPGAPNKEEAPVSLMMPQRRRTDQLSIALAEANRRIGILHALAIVKPALLAGDVDGALRMCNELTRDAIQPVPAVAPAEPEFEPPHAGLIFQPDPDPELVKVGWLARIGERLIAFLWRRGGWEREYETRDREA